MVYSDLKKLTALTYFTTEDVAYLFKLKSASARVMCNRYVKKGVFLRLKKNFYVLDQKWTNPASEDLLKISNYLQVPSYVSFMTALSFYGVTTQVQRDFFESASLKRSVRFDAQGRTFNFYKLQKKYYFGFIKKNNIFIATKEKAFIDAVYLYSFGKYRLDFNALDMAKLDKKNMKTLLKSFPKKTKDIIGRL